MNTASKDNTHNIGKLGTALTLICSIHCMVTPFLALFIPFFDTKGIDWLELAIIFGVLVLGSSTLWHSYKGHHGKFFPLGLFSFGILLMIAGMVVHESTFEILHKALMVAGSLISAVAQVWNIKLAR